jgi:hypothetical protein
MIAQGAITASGRHTTPDAAAMNNKSINPS